MTREGVVGGGVVISRREKRICVERCVGVQRNDLS